MPDLILADDERVIIHYHARGETQAVAYWVDFSSGQCVGRDEQVCGTLLDHRHEFRAAGADAAAQAVTAMRMARALATRSALDTTLTAQAEGAPDVAAL